MPAKANTRQHPKYPPKFYQSPTYVTWKSMKSRCANPFVKNYGGRGIKVCKRWEFFAYFLDDMGERPSPGHSLERMSNSDHYTPENCRWATRSEQARNTRGNVVYTVRGITGCVAELCEHFQVPYKRAYYRMYSYGWRPEDAFTTPLVVKFLTIGGVRKKITEWAKIAKLDSRVIHWRISQNWPTSDLLKAQFKSRHKHTA